MEVQGDYVLQFGKYKGKSFRWLLQNDVGYTVYLIKNVQNEEAAGLCMADSHSKDSLQSFVSYALSFQEIQALLTYEGGRGDGVTASSEDDQLVGFGARAKSRWKEIWDSRGDGYADFVIGRRCVPGTRMSRLQQNLLKRQQPTTSSTPAEHPMKAPAEPLAMEEDVEMEREMLSIHNSDLQVQSYAMPVAAAALPTPLTQDSIEKIVQGILEMEQQQQRPEQKMRQTKPCLACGQPKSRYGTDGSSIHFFYQQGPVRYFYCSRKVHQTYAAEGLSDPRMPFEQFAASEFFQRELEATKKRVEEKAQRQRLGSQPPDRLCRFCHLTLKQGPNSPHIHTGFPGVAGKHIYCPSKVYSLCRDKGMARERTWKEFVATPFFEAERRRWMEERTK